MMIYAIGALVVIVVGLFVYRMRRPQRVVPVYYTPEPLPPAPPPATIPDVYQVAPIPNHLLPSSGSM